MEKPNSKVIQISADSPEKEPYFTRSLNFIALCEDGSIWHYIEGMWECILEAIDNAK